MATGTALSGITSWISDTAKDVKDFATDVSDRWDTATADRTLIDEDGFGQANYDFDYKTFPNDVGSEHMGHYMMININVPVNKKEGSDATLRTGVPDLGNTTLLPKDVSKVDNLRFNPRFNPNPGSTNSQRELYALQRSTRRIAQTIVLHMPSSVIFTSQNIYEDVSLTAIGGQIGKLGVTALGKIAGAAAGAFMRKSAQAGQNTGQTSGSMFDTLGKYIGPAFQIAGEPINPRVEVLFATTPQRQFMFEVLMAPRNEKESITIREIIKTLRYHAAPEIDNIGPIPTYVPPAEFDITFFHKNEENLNIPRINTCVLQRIDVDYAPTNGIYSTFSNGHPVAVRLSLSFMETEIVHKLRVAQGF